MDGIDYDAFGPEKVLDVYHPKLGLRGFVVIDSTALGPAKGGIRMTSSVSMGEVAKLARTMTWKNALADLPFGGGKAGIIADDRNISEEKKEELVRSFAQAVKPFIHDYYVAGPDMNMAEAEMRQFSEELDDPKACTGKPADMGGIPHELGSTGFGVTHAAEVAAEHIDLDLEGATVAIEGFGNVGWFVAKHITERGAELVAVSDSSGVAYLEDGLDFQQLAETKEEEGAVTEYEGAEKLPGREIVSLDVDILVTAAIPDLIKIGDVDDVQASLIVEGSNIPMSHEVEKALHAKGVTIVPDFVANAGGVISSYMEWVGKSEEEMFQRVEDTIRDNTANVLEKADEDDTDTRTAALEIARKKVLDHCDVCQVDF